MPHVHVRSIAKTVRWLYIALAVVLAMVESTAPVRAGNLCDAAVDGTLCPDDEDPCTNDQCTAGICHHDDVPNRVTCDPVVDAYRRTLGLGDLVQEISALAAAATLPDASRLTIEKGLDGTGADLALASDVLAGRIPIPAPEAGQTLAQTRAHAAFTIARMTPPRVRTVLLALSGPSTADLARRARFLYRSTNQLKRELRRLQRVSGVFTR
jgi:hypothetical protein